MDIFVDSQFSGGHHLRNYPGACERPHGHNWKVRATLRVLELDELGLGIDFKEFKAHVAAVLDTLDHTDLNQHPAFKDKNPSSENIAIYIFHALQPKIFEERFVLHSVEVRETENAGVIYYGER